MRREKIRTLHRQLYRGDAPPLRLIVVHGECGTIETGGKVLAEMPETGSGDLVLTLSGSRYDDGPRPVFLEGLGAVHVGPRETPEEWNARAAAYRYPGPGWFTQNTQSPAYNAGDNGSRVLSKKELHGLSGEY